jgi:hypothetical protein
LVFLCREKYRFKRRFSGRLPQDRFSAKGGVFPKTLYRKKKTSGAEGAKADFSLWGKGAKKVIFWPSERFEVFSAQDALARSGITLNLFLAIINRRDRLNLFCPKGAKADSYSSAKADSYSSAKADFSLWG